MKIKNIAERPLFISQQNSFLQTKKTEEIPPVQPSTESGNNPKRKGQQIDIRV